VKHRLVRGLLAVVLMSGAAVVAAEAPAFAAGACSGHPNVNPCVNYGDSGANKVRADFYLNTGPNFYLYYYDVVIFINGTAYWKTSGFTPLGSQGRKCCWYQTYDNLPNTYNSAFTRVNIYRQDHQYYMTVNSPTINFWS
jgi:hypothetical protein